MTLWRRVFVERRRAIVPLLAVLAINVAVLVLVVFPLQASVNSEEGRAGEVRAELADARRAERVADETKASQARAGEELQQFYSDVLPRRLASARDLLFLNLRMLSRSTGVEFSNGGFQTEDVEGSSLVRFQIDAELTGDYQNIRRFIYELESSGDFFVIESVKLGQSNLDPGAGGSLQIVVKVATYFTRAQR